jgi:hypothetical protein
MATKFALLGMDGPGIAHALEITFDTFNRFMKDFPAFRRAVNEGKANADAHMAASLYKRGMGLTTKEVRTHQDAEGQVSETVTMKEAAPDTTAAIFWLKNRQRAYWRDVSDKNVNINEPVRLDDPRVIDVTDWTEEEREELERKLDEQEGK